MNYHDAPDSGNVLVAGDKRYQLTQFHFHRPSEEYIGGKPYDMVIHFMHAGSDGKIAGVAVLLKAGSANATIQQIWEHMPKSESKEQEIAGVEINPAKLLPRDSDYYTYMGSLTAPPVPGRIGKICDFRFPFFRFGLCPPLYGEEDQRRDEISNP